MSENLEYTFINFNEINIDTILYIKLSYTDEQNNLQEIKTTVASCSNTYMFLKLKQIGKLNINCPQQAKIKIVTNETLYQGEVKLSEIVYHSDWIGFAIEKPERLERVQEREYFRIRAGNKTATIYYTDSHGQAGELNSTIFDIAVKSIKVYNLQLPDGTPLADFSFDNFQSIRIKMNIEGISNITFPASFLKYRIQDGKNTFIFLFQKTDYKTESMLSKTLIDIQRAQLHQSNTKN